jgi:hypothetical protein
MFAFPDVFNFFAYKLASLSGGGLAFALVFACSFHCFFFWHNKNGFARSSSFGCK